MIEQDVRELRNNVEARQMARGNLTDQPSVVQVAGQIVGLDVLLPDARDRDQQRDNSAKRKQPGAASNADFRWLQFRIYRSVLRFRRLMR